MENTVSPRKKNALRGSIFVLLGGICWGFSGTCGQYLFATEGVDSGWLTTIRMLLAGAILLAAALVKNRPQVKGILLDKKDRWVLFLFAIFGIMLNQYTYLTAISYTNSGTATVLQDTGPVFILIVVCIQTLRLPTLKEIISILFALAGVFLMATHGNLSSLAISPQGLFWGLASAIMLMLYNVIPIKLLDKWGSLAVSGTAMFLGGIILFFCTRFWNCSVDISLNLVLGIAGIVLVGTVCSYSFFLVGLRDIGPVKASLLCCIEPVAAVFFAAAWMKTEFTLVDIIGIAFIMATVLLLTKQEAPQPALDSETPPEEAAEAEDTEKTDEDAELHAQDRTAVQNKTE